MEKSIAACSAKPRLKHQTSIASADIPVAKAGLNKFIAADRQHFNSLSHALVQSLHQVLLIQARFAWQVTIRIDRIELTIN
jgi:hypothetical protein